ncbi:MAG: hypothetical protein AB7F53_06320 [Nitrososphaeraceae archaeon]
MSEFTIFGKTLDKKNRLRAISNNLQNFKDTIKAKIQTQTIKPISS